MEYAISIVRDYWLDYFQTLKKQTQKIISNVIKSYLLKTGLFDKWRNYQRALYYKDLILKGERDSNPYEEYLSYDLKLNSLELKICWRLFNARRSRVSRLKKRLNYVISHYDCLFLRLSFTDDVLKNTSSKTRRTYIARWLKSLDIPFYIANIDFGDKEKNPDSKEREHYHAVVQCSYVDMSSYKYGYMFVERVRHDSSSLVRISKYVNKLSYHAFKDSVGQSRLIYSKPVKSNRIKFFKDKRLDNYLLQSSL